MNKLTILILLSLIGMGCNLPKSKEVPTEDVNRYWRVITIDGCEYIEGKQSYACPLIHKANCKNPIHYK